MRRPRNSRRRYSMERGCRGLLDSSVERPGLIMRRDVEKSFWENTPITTISSRLHGCSSVRLRDPNLAQLSNALTHALEPKSDIPLLYAHRLRERRDGRFTASVIRTLDTRCFLC